MTDKPRVNLSERDGNAHVIMGACRQAARRAGWTKAEIDTVISEMEAGDYEHLLRVAILNFDVY